MHDTPAQIWWICRFTFLPHVWVIVETVWLTACSGKPHTSAAKAPFKESFACNNLAITVQLLSIRYSILSIPTIWALRADSSGLEAQHEASVCINLLLRDPGCHRYVSRTWGALLSEFGTNNHKRQYVQALMITWSNWKQRCSRLTVGSMAASKLRPLFWSGSDKRYRDPWPCVLLSVLAQCHCHCARFLSHGSRT